MRAYFFQLLTCICLLPAAYIEAGTLSSLQAHLKDQGKEYLLGILVSRKKIGHACSRLPRWQAIGVLFFFFTASYLQKHGSIYNCFANCFAKLGKFGIKEIVFSVRAELQKLQIQQEDKQHRALLYFDASINDLSFICEFIKCLSGTAYKVDFFIAGNPFFDKRILKLKQAGAHRAVARSTTSSVMQYSYEIGDSYSIYIVPGSCIRNEIVDTFRYVSPHAVMLAICDDSAELQSQQSSLLEKFNHIICRKISHEIEGASIILAPTLDREAKNFQLTELFRFFAECEILPLRMAFHYYAQYPLSVAVTTINPNICLAVQSDDVDGSTRAAVGAFLSECVQGKLSCEIIFWGKSLPRWAHNLSVKWKFLEVTSEFTLEALSLLDRNASAKTVFVLQSGVLPLEGILSAFKLLNDSCEVQLCGCRLITESNSLYEAGAFLCNDSPVRIGSNQAISSPFFKITRSVPLLSLRALFFKKGLTFSEDQCSKILFLPQNGGYIGFRNSSSLSVVCGEMTACMQDNSLSTACDLVEWTDEDAIQIAAQDHYIPIKIDNTIRILYYSPYQSHPASHGNRSTIQYFGKLFKKLGCEVHFALLGLDHYSQKDLSDMRAAWDSLTILPYPFQDNSHLGIDIPYDEWYENGLGEHIAYLCSLYSIDMLFCSYVFQSKMLEYVPRHVLKVIDTHDKMGGRYAAQKARGVKTEFFSCSPEDEGRYLRRADIVVARRDEEAKYFDEVTGKKTAIVIPHVEPPHYLERHYNGLNSVGLVASANKINLDLVADFLQALSECNREIPFTVKVAGQVVNLVKELPPSRRALFSHPWVKMLGFVENISDFYESVDLIVSPVTLGTGINVKTVQAMSYGMPLVTTAFGCKGIETGHAMHSFASIDEIVDALCYISAAPAMLKELATCSRERYNSFYKESLEGFCLLVNEVKSRKMRIQKKRTFCDY